MHLISIFSEINWTFWSVCWWNFIVLIKDWCFVFTLICFGICIAAIWATFLRIQFHCSVQELFLFLFSLLLCAKARPCSNQLCEPAESMTSGKPELWSTFIADLVKSSKRFDRKLNNQKGDSYSVWWFVECVF